MKRNQNGFGLLGVLAVIIVVVVVGVVGVAAWYVYKKNNKQETTKTPSSEQANNPSPEASEVKDETANWKEVKNSAFVFTYKYPNETGWENTVTTTPTDAAAYAQGERINSASVVYTLCGKNCGLAFDLRVFVKGSQADVGGKWAEETMADNTVYKLLAKEAVTLDGVSGTKWVYEPQGEYKESAAKIVFYYFTKDNLSYAMRANSNGAATDKIDITSYGEKIASTFKFSK